MRLPRVAVLGGLGLLAGCGGPRVARPVTLAQLADHSLQFTLADVDSIERDSSVGAHRFTLVFGGSSECVQLTGDVTATLNGQPMQLSPGGVPDTGVGGREVCNPPIATFDFDPAQWDQKPIEDVTVLLQDGASGVRLVLHDARAKRSFHTDALSPGTLRRGQERLYEWQPTSDPVSGSIQIALVHKATNVSTPLTVEQPGSQAQFLVPQRMVEGAYYLILSGTADLQVSACEGVMACAGGVFHSEEFDVTVTP